MRNKKISMKLVAAALAFCTAVSVFGACCIKVNANGLEKDPLACAKNEKNFAEYTGSVIKEIEFGGAYIEADSEEFLSEGFKYGDSCNVTFSNGYTLNDIPFYNGYYARCNFPAIVDYQGEPHVCLAFCSGDSMWDKAECVDGDSVTITLNERGKYLANQNAMNMVYSDNRDDFESDEMFANFRVMKGGHLKDGVLYRGASPVNNIHNRANTVDSFIEKNKVGFILDLADNADRIEDYMGCEDFRSDYFMKLYSEDKVATVGLNAAFESEDYAKKLAAGLNKMSRFEGPFYVHCTEGKDRTGFVCILLEAVGGCSYDEIKDDYMYTYYNYFGITEENNPETYEAIIENRFLDMIFYLTGTEDEAVARKADLEQAARNYLLGGGMTETEYDILVHRITMSQ